MFRARAARHAAEQPAPGRRPRRRRARSRTRSAPRPGCVCPVGDGKVVYAVPGVPYEMQQMVTEHVLPDLLRALGRGGGDRVALAEDVGHVGVGARGDDRAPARRARRDRQPDDRVPRPRHRGPRRAHHREGARPRPRRARWSTPKRSELRAILGDLVFGVDDETMESRGARAPARRAAGRSASPSRSPAGSSARASSNVPGASDTFRGTIASYATDVKRSVLGVTAEPVVSEEVARRRWPRARSACSAPTSASRPRASPGPTEQDGVAVGTVCFGIALPGRPAEAVLDPAARRPRAHPPVLDDLAAEPAAAAARRARARARTRLMLVEIQINVDCADLDRMVDFYTASARVRAARLERHDVPVDRARPTGDGPKLVFQKVPEAQGRQEPGAPRPHRRPRHRARSRTVRRARRDARERGTDRRATAARWIVMQDPEGNELCLCTS